MAAGKSQVRQQKTLNTKWLEVFALVSVSLKLRYLHRIKLFGDRDKELILEDVTSESDQPKKPARNQRCMACNPAELPKSVSPT